MTLEFEVRDRVARITLNRPEALNAIDPETIRALSEAWAEVRDNNDIWVALVRGGGDRAFSAGMDVKKTITRSAAPANFYNSQRLQTLERGLEVNKPVVAAIHGYCLGGGLTLALACDIRIASDDAVFGLPEIKRAIFPSEGATWRLPRQVPWAVAMEMLILGENIDAQRAYDVGLVNKVVPRDELEDAAEDVVERLLALPPLTMRATKESALRCLDLPLDEALRFESLMSRTLRTTQDFKEGPASFTEKRTPVYRGE
ncbi:MAG: enoyl-CoA hydratase/isomerase family protein [Dehalococcoidia bacterium]